MEKTKFSKLNFEGIFLKSFFLFFFSSSIWVGFLLQPSFTPPLGPNYMKSWCLWLFEFGKFCKFRLYPAKSLHADQIPSSLLRKSDLVEKLEEVLLLFHINQDKLPSFHSVMQSS